MEYADKNGFDMILSGFVLEKQGEHIERWIAKYRIVNTVRHLTPLPTDIRKLISGKQVTDYTKYLVRCAEEDEKRFKRLFGAIAAAPVGKIEE